MVRGATKEIKKDSKHERQKDRKQHVRRAHHLLSRLLDRADARPGFLLHGVQRLLRFDAPRGALFAHAVQLLRLCVEALLQRRALGRFLPQCGVAALLQEAPQPERLAAHGVYLVLRVRNLVLRCSRRLKVMCEWAGSL
jgi:hypothetical protein